MLQRFLFQVNGVIFLFSKYGEKTWESNQHFTMISEESYDSEDWSNIKIENNYFKL